MELDVVFIDFLRAGQPWPQDHDTDDESDHFFQHCEPPAPPGVQVARPRSH